MSKAAKIRVLLAEGMEVADIAKKLKFTVPYVSQVRWHWQKNKVKAKPKQAVVDMVNQPPHYTTGGIETVDFIEAKGLDYHLGNVVKYVSRAMHKGNELEDLKKAAWYLARRIEKMERNSGS